MLKRLIAGALVALAALSSHATAQSWKQLQWGLNTADSPYQVGVNLSGSWYRFATVTPGGAFSLSDVSKPPFAQGLVIKNNATTPDTKIDISAGLVFLSSSSGSAFFSSASLTINATTTGVDGLDTGSLAANEEYYVFLISDGTNIKSLLSLSATSPTMPAGYTMAQRFGAFKTDGSSKFYRVIQNGNRAQYAVTAATNTASMWMLNNANTGSISTPTYTAFQVTGAGKAAPATATAVDVILTAIAGAGGSTMVAPNSAYGASTSLTNPAPMVVTSIAASQSRVMILESNSIYIASNNATLSAVLISGWVDSVPAI